MAGTVPAGKDLGMTDGGARWDPVHQKVIELFQQHGPLGMTKTRVSGFLKELGVVDDDAGLLLATFGLTADDDEIDFEAFVAWLFHDVVTSTEKKTVDINNLATGIAEEIKSCEGALAHVVYVQPAGTSDADAAEELHIEIGGSKLSRIGVIGSITYNFPGDRYKDAGPEGVERMVKIAAESLMANGKPSRVVCGGAYSGPQRTFAETCEQHAQQPLTMVHVIPNTDKALKDLQAILWDDKVPRVRKCRWTLAFVGSTISRRNCMLASLNGNYIMCGGGPGTHTELCEMRCNGSGVLPLVRSGGLSEGARFGDKHTEGMVDGLRTSPPHGVAEESWQTMLGEGEASLDEYCRAVEQVFGALRFRGTSTPRNLWPMSAQERKAWEDARQTSEMDKAKS